jgi:hypothetical protein
MPYFWLSFVDPRKPKGEQFLGTAMVKGASPGEAVERGWRIGIDLGDKCKSPRSPVTSSRNAVASAAIGCKAELNDAGEFSEYDRARRH